MLTHTLAAPQTSVASDFSVRFWGVRGSVACPSGETMRYGGNTSALEIRCGKHLLLFDCGTGARYLGRELCKQAPLDADLFLTHTHFDHICGMPFFVPLFDKRNRFRVFAGHLGPNMTIKYALSELMMAPLFPVPLEIFAASISFQDFRAGDTLHPRPGVTLRTIPLNHPNGATGYRIEYAGKSICYLTDTEHKIGAPDRNILNLIQDADIVIYDCMYTDQEYRDRVGWGHSTWQEGARLCAAANVKTFVVFHHDPDHDDDFMDKVAADVAAVLPGSVVAREGLLLRP
ncbi:MAG TPA: MBL fold metallo-hydrolase [Candidatus Cybelea sp.]|nr:MBL fold metallo-hydrolase [Candidatus Cybelea sp.]